MPEWEAGMISKQPTRSTDSASSGVWRLNNHLRHEANSTWHDSEALDDTYDDAGKRFVVNIFQSTSGDSNEDYDYVTADFDPAILSVGHTGRIYLCIKVTANTWYYNDFVIGAIQLTHTNQTDLERGWAFFYTVDYQSWEKPNIHNLDNISAGYEDLSDILAAPSQTWSSLQTGGGNYKIGWVNSTGSTYTGANNGVGNMWSSELGGIGNIFTGSEPQINPSNYLYTESSGTSGYISNGFFWMRSPEMTLDNAVDNYDLSVLYLAATNSPATFGMTDSVAEPIFRWFWSSLS